MASTLERHEKEIPKFHLTDNGKVIQDNFVEEKLKEDAVIRKTLINEKIHMRQTIRNFENKFNDFQSDVMKHMIIMNDSIQSNIDNLEHIMTEHKTEVDHRLTVVDNEIENSFNETDFQIQGISDDVQSKLIESDSKMKRIEKSFNVDITKVSQRLSTVDSNLASAKSGLNSRLNNAESQLRTLSSKQERQEDTLSDQISSLSNRISKEEARKVAFSARLNKKQSYYGKSERIVFDLIIYSHGGGYSPSTGIFTAPKSGTYLFTFNVESTPSGSTHVLLKVDGSYTTRALSNKGAYNNGGNAGISYVWKGEKVWVETASIEDKYYIWPYRTTFNGVLID